MKKLALALAVTSALTLSTPAASATLAPVETEEARVTATSAAAIARADKRDTFGNKKLKPGQYLWKEGHAGDEASRVVIGLSDQQAYVYAGNELIGVSTISSGKEAKPTPTGIFPIQQKKRHHRSIKYDNAPMPHMQRLDRWGIAIHGGHLPGYPASHGCVRLPGKFAAKLFTLTDVGTPVLIGA